MLAGLAAIATPVRAGSDQGPDPQARWTNDHLTAGLRAFGGGQFGKAAPLLEQALSELKSRAGFERSWTWRVLVHDLGRAYFFTRNFPKAAATVQYGMAVDPDYAMFPYDLATVQAATRNRDAAIESLTRAFALKDHLNPGEELPDPATDEAFQPMRKDAAFNQAVLAIKTAGRRFPDRLDFSIAGAPWDVTVPAGDFVVRQRELTDGGRALHVLFDSPSTKLTVSLFLEPATRCQSAEACRDMLKRDNLQDVEHPTNVQTTTIGDTPVLEYLVPVYKGQPIRQLNVFAEFVVDNYWVDLHASKILYVPEDRRLFDTFVRSVRFERR